jgi:hypothetical protein
MQSTNDDGSTISNNPSNETRKIQITNSMDISTIKTRYEEFMKDSSDGEMIYSEIIYDPANIKINKKS